MKKEQTISVGDAGQKAESNISDILDLAHSYLERGEVNAARILFDRVTTSCHGMIEYAHFLLAVPALDNLSKYERVKKAEKLLLYVKENGSEQEMCEACIMLANLYRHTKEIRSLGFFMRANRYGSKEDTVVQAHLLKQITKMEISDVESDPYGCYVAGIECAQFTGNPAMMKWALYFLEMAVENGYSAIAGLAAMRMADLYDEHFHDEKMCSHYKNIATTNGNPEVLTKQ